MIDSLIVLAALLTLARGKPVNELADLLYIIQSFHLTRIPATKYH
jgi:hypothetical protein